MKKLLNILNIAVLVVSVITASVFAAHIPPLWGPFTVSVLIMAGSLFLRRTKSRAELLHGNASNNPVSIFRELIRQALSSVEKLIQKNDLKSEDADLLEDLTERLTTEMDQIHPALVEALGMKPFIDVILPYARGERMIHRALSALTDRYPEEARAILRESLPFLKEAQEKLDNNPPSRDETYIG